jgi:hypothetical protein
MGSQPTSIYGAMASKICILKVIRWIRAEMTNGGVHCVGHKQRLHCGLGTSSWPGVESWNHFACSFLSGWVGLAPLPLRDMLGALYFYSCLGSKASLCAKKKKKTNKKKVETTRHSDTMELKSRCDIFWYFQKPRGCISEFHYCRFKSEPFFSCSNDSEHCMK